MSMASLLLILAAIHAAPNPVLPGAADCGVLRFNGEYYLMGMGTAGALHVSNDLVTWSGPKHAFSMDNAWATGSAAADSEIHACDLSLYNGRFHLYWSVNHGKLRAIGHAVADRVLGPYQELSKERPFDGRIDPHLFVDDFGRLCFYTVKFGTGNTIWGQPMRNPSVLQSEPVRLLSALPDTWEWQDEGGQAKSGPEVNEAPCVVRYRGRCYMLYNANHTSARYGNYAIGVAEAAGPLDFANENKYPFPVLSTKRPASAEAGTAPAHYIRNCGQPNLVRGPNGFEWWLVYFGIVNGTKGRNQCIDRVHFFGKELFVEGPTHATIPGYYPVPALATFRDLFEHDGPLGKAWDTGSSEWRVQGGHATQPSGEGTLAAKLRGPKGRFYVFETGLRLLDEAGWQAGVIAWEAGPECALYIGLDQKAKSWFWALRQEYNVRTETFPLPANFHARGWHALRVEKNGAVVTVLLDGLPAPGNPVIQLPEDAEGMPGLITRNAAAAFDGTTFTLGWDEFGKHVQGWGAAQSGTPSAGQWIATPSGLRAEPGHAQARAFKGDRYATFDWSLQLRPGTSKVGLSPEALCAVGVYAVYVDEENYLTATADPGFARLTVQGVREGRVLERKIAPIVKRQHRARPASESGYNLRVRKMPNRVLFFVDGQEVLSYPGKWPPAQPGLLANGVTCYFDGITFFERSIGRAP